jgi:16S rRNA (cytosine1402-N4)-methyltransferase
MTMSVVPIEPNPPAGHVTVMPAEVLCSLRPASGELYVDFTAGGGGHSEAILEACPSARVIAFDRDPHAVSRTRARLAPYAERAVVARVAFDESERWLAAHGIAHVDGTIADLGLSSFQLDDPRRGMSFRLQGPIDMRMEPDRGEAARDLIARLSQAQLAQLIREFGEEKRARRVARCVKQALAAGRLKTTLDLRRAVVNAVGPRRVGGVDPATRTFQALRIAVNGELRQLGSLLKLTPRIVRPGGRVVFLTFHSLEDRMVKQALADREVWQRMTGKPVTASDIERARNPRARSAKLRAATRLPAAGCSDNLAGGDEP